MPLLLGSLKQRRLEPEWMDQPGLDQQLHAHALAGLGRINWISGSGHTLWQALQGWASTHGDAPLRVLDLACGGGDVTLDIARRAALAGVSIELAGCDCSPVAVEHARTRAAGVGLEKVQFFEHQLLRDPLPEGYDVYLSSLFLHHLTVPDAQALLSQMASAAQKGVLISDLRRTSWGYYLAWWGCRLLSRSPVVHQDGPQSVKAAFTPAEALHMAAESGMPDARLTFHWPQRFLLKWRRV